MVGTGITEGRDLGLGSLSRPSPSCNLKTKKRRLLNFHSDFTLISEILGWDPVVERLACVDL